MSLIKITYQQKKQQVYAEYEIYMGKTLRIDILRKSVDITEFCRQFLTIQPLDIPVEPCELQRKSTKEFFMKLKKFKNMIEALLQEKFQQVVSEMSILEKIISKIESIQDDLRRRILPLSLLYEVEINEKNIEESCKPLEEHIQQKLDQIKCLNDWVTCVLKEKLLECQSYESFQGLYVLKTNIQVPIDGVIQQVIKVGMTRLPLKDRLYSLKDEYNRRVIYTQLFFQYFPSQKTIDLPFHKYLTEKIPKSKFYVLKDNLENNSKYSISCELYILTDEFLEQFIPYLKDFVQNLIDRPEEDSQSNESEVSEIALHNNESQDTIPTSKMLRVQGQMKEDILLEKNKEKQDQQEVFSVKSQEILPNNQNLQQNLTDLNFNSNDDENSKEETKEIDQLSEQKNQTNSNKEILINQKENDTQNLEEQKEQDNRQFEKNEQDSPINQLNQTNFEGVPLIVDCKEQQNYLAHQNEKEKKNSQERLTDLTYKANIFEETKEGQKQTDS